LVLTVFFVGVDCGHIPVPQKEPLSVLQKALLALALALVLMAWAGPGSTFGVAFTVTKTGDTADGTCDGDCSLREAIIQANARFGPDTITIPAGIYTLAIAGTNEDGALTGDLDINGDQLTIIGAGPTATIIDGGGLDRVFSSYGRSPNAKVIRALTIRNGASDSDIGGGAIINSDSAMALVDVVISQNSAGYGGGIYNAYAELYISRSSVIGNTASVMGGGLLNNNGVLSVENTTVSSNSSVSGGGIAISGGTLSVTSISHSTITASTANNGAVWKPHPFSPSAVVTHTIIANNTGGDCAATPIQSEGHNMDTDGSCGLSATGDMSNTDPSLGPLQSNGGPTLTHALLAGSPAIDGGDIADCAPTDQRQVARPLDGDGDGSPFCDIGAYEYCTVERNDVDCDFVGDIAEVACGAEVVNGASRPERVDTPGDDDGDTLVNEALPAGAGAYDCDGDGFAGSAEGQITTSDQDPCGGSGWPSELVSNGGSANRLDLQDLGSFLMPVRRLGTGPGHPGYSARWDLVPGSTVGAAINIADIAATVIGPSGHPPMFGGQRAFGRTCPWAP
jgi:CSLREA domain-containing protein